MIQDNQAKISWQKIAILAAAVLVLGVWLWYTPPGIFGKSDAVGYAVCHQISERSFRMGERQFPLCARCSGMYLGAFVAFAYQLKHKRAGELPPKKILIILGFLLILFAIDGGNSYLHFFDKAPSLYEPNNTLRLITGLGLGIGMAALLYPIFNQTIWKEWIPQPAINSYVDLMRLTLFNAAIFLIINSGNMILMFLLALIGSATIVLMLSMIYTILITMLLKKENSYTGFQALSWTTLAGFCIAMLQIGVMDFIRFWLTGTWAGFSL